MTWFTEESNMRYKMNHPSGTKWKTDEQGAFVDVLIFSACMLRTGLLLAKLLLNHLKDNSILYCAW